jgi:rRNA pseudouridine-1189 N-methylase Emg1 (Nep1/Mra1 family)
VWLNYKALSIVVTVKTTQSLTHSLTYIHTHTHAHTRTHKLIELSVQRNLPKTENTFYSVLPKLLYSRYILAVVCNFRVAKIILLAPEVVPAF